MATTSVRDAIEKLSKVFAQEPERARSKNPPATATLEGGLKFQVTGPQGERFSTDMPPALGGGGTGPNPGWLLRASLASCTATMIAMRAAQVGVALMSLEVSVTSESDSRGLLGTDDSVSAGLAGLRTQVKIGAEGAAPDQLQEIVRWARGVVQAKFTFDRTAGSHSLAAASQRGR
jgi:uncharacterized OsmC-like protein